MAISHFTVIEAFVFEKLATELAPTLYYHNIAHTRDDVYPAAQQLAHMEGVDGEDYILLTTAALYHDVGFCITYDNHEAASVEIAKETLPQFGFSKTQIAIVGDIIMVTKLPQNPTNLLQAIICDADLDSLGREDFFVTSHNLHREFKYRGLNLTVREWYQRQLNFLKSHQYFTSAAIKLRMSGKQHNINELTSLVNP